MADPERDERVSANYRALGREEPPAALDAAILAAARRRGLRWGVPVSIAAVLVLAAGVTLRMQREQPDTETAVPAPQAMEARRPASSAQDVAPARSEVVIAAKPAEAVPEPKLNQAGRLASRERDVGPRAAAFASAPASAPPSTAGAVQESRARVDSAAKSVEEALAPEVWLDRIAAMRKAGRVKEADERYAAFKRKYPNYRIPEAMLGKVAPAQ